MALIRRIGNLFRRVQVDGEIDAELQAHIEMRTEENIAQGMSRDEARRDLAGDFAFVDRFAAQPQFGDLGQPRRTHERHVAFAREIADQRARVVARDRSRGRQDRDQARSGGRRRRFDRGDRADESDAGMSRA